MNIDLLLYVAAFILFVAAAIGISSRVNLIGAGLACYTLAAII